MPIYNTDPEPVYPWWYAGVIYQIYPRSFQDTNNDGIGDLRGIEQRLHYLHNLGIDAIWISPFFKSPMADFGYDIADYCDIDPIFGTMADFDSLLDAAHALNIRIIIDFVPNHTSDQHPWFIESRQSRESAKRDWYIWRDPKSDGSPPNNLVGFFGGSAWKYDDTTGQYYLHMFLEGQPDLNWRNPDVVAAIHAVLRFWLDKGVDGFRLDAITTLIKRETLNDLPEDALSLTGVDLLFRLTEMHNQPELHTLLKGFRRVLDAYDGDRVLVGETNTADFRELMTFYGTDLDEIQLPMNLQTLLLPWDAGVIRESIRAYYDALAPGATPNFVFGNHDRSRPASRYGEANHRAALLLLLTLWGVPTVYYGDELGMVDGHILPDQRQDPFAGEAHNVGTGRDPERTPMQWDDSPNAGFTADGVTPWLPVRTTFTSSVAAQRDDPTSTLNFCKALIRLRRESPALIHGSIRFRDDTHPDVLIYERQTADDHLLVAINFGTESHTLDLPAGEVVLSTRMDTPPDTLRPHEGVIWRVNVFKT